MEISALLAEPFMREHLVGNNPYGGRRCGKCLIHLLDPRPVKSDLVMVDGAMCSARIGL